jgi:hypothetical protein
VPGSWISSEESPLILNSSECFLVIEDGYLEKLSVAELIEMHSRTRETQNTAEDGGLPLWDGKLGQKH